MAEAPNSGAKTRIVYREKPAGRPLTDAEALRAARLIGRDRDLTVPELVIFADSLQGRSVESFGVLAYLIPEDERVQDYLAAKGHLRDDARLIGTGFFGNTTGILHDLAFDYELIDSLSEPTDQKADSYLLQLLLEKHGDRMVFAMAKLNDERRTSLLASQGLEEQKEVGEGVLYGRSIPDLFSSDDNDDLELPEPKPKDSEAEKRELTEAETIEALRDQLNGWYLHFELSPEVAAEILGKDRILIGEAARFGVGDTVVREQSVGTVSRALIGRAWPLIGEGQSDEEHSAMQAELKLAHDALLSKLQG